MNKKRLNTRKHLKEIGSLKTFNDVIESSTLLPMDKDIVRMHYLEGKDFCYIGDILGYSESGIKKRHTKILKKLGSFL